MCGNIKSTNVENFNISRVNENTWSLHYNVIARLSSNFYLCSTLTNVEMYSCGFLSYLLKGIESWLEYFAILKKFAILSKFSTLKKFISVTFDIKFFTSNLTISLIVNQISSFVFLFLKFCKKSLNFQSCQVALVPDHDLVQTRARTSKTVKERKQMHKEKEWFVSASPRKISDLICAHAECLSIIRSSSSNNPRRTNLFYHQHASITLITMNRSTKWSKMNRSWMLKMIRWMPASSAWCIEPTRSVDFPYFHRVIIKFE